MARIWRGVEQCLTVVTLLALACLVILPFTQVVLRDLFSSPIVGLEEGTRWGLIALVFLALPLLVTLNGQIRFAELVDRLPLAARRFFERVMVLAAAGTLTVIAWAGLGSVLQNTGTRTPTLDIPFWLFALPFLVGTAIAAIGYVWIAFRREPPPTASGTETL